MLPYKARADGLIMIDQNCEAAMARVVVRRLETRAAPLHGPRVPPHSVSHASADGLSCKSLNHRWLRVTTYKNMYSEQPKSVILNGAGGGGRTHMTSEGRGILSPVRLPVPPLQQVELRQQVITNSSQV